MKIIQLTSNDAKTGGAIAVTRLHEALLKAGHESRIYSYHDLSKRRPAGWRVLDGINRRISDFLALPGVYWPSFALVKRAIDDFRPDIIHLHWTYSGGIPLSGLPSLAKDYPLVWTFHDMWPITGGCTNSLGCERWRAGCGDCPQWNVGPEVASMSPMRRDSTKQLWHYKEFIYRRSAFSVICPSRWITNLAQQSPLLTGHITHNIPNSIDTDFWKPVDKLACKAALNIPAEKKVILTVGKPGSIFAYPGRRSILAKTLSELKNLENHSAEQWAFLMVGGGGNYQFMDGFQIIDVGIVTSSAMMRVCYNAADLLFDPTQFDNFPGVIEEALACGTPVVASDVGGVPDLVRNNETGFLVPPNEPYEFAVKISQLLSDNDLSDRISKKSRQIAIDEYRASFVVEMLIPVYQQKLQKSCIQ